MTLRWRKAQSAYRAVGRDRIALYVIEGTPYGTGKSWQLFVNGERVPLGFSRRLRDLKEKAQAMESKR